MRGLCGGWIFFVGWVGYLSFVCRCSHPVSQMDKGGYSSVDTSSSATVNKPSLLRRVVSSSIASMGKPTKRSILIEKIQSTKEGSREKCIASNQLYNTT